MPWFILALIILLGVTAGFFLSAFLIILLVIICAVALFILWLDVRGPSNGTSGGIGIALLMVCVILFLIPMVFTALVVRMGDNNLTNHLSDAGGWLKRHLLR